MQRPVVIFLLGLAVAACDRDQHASKPAPPSRSSAKASTSAPDVARGDRSGVAPAARGGTSLARRTPKAELTGAGSDDAAEFLASLPPIPNPELARMFRELSEPDRYFFSDNYLSNETSYLQVASELTERVRRGGAYLGVGPEQNFSYIALTRPKLAFIVDIRRQNALQHWLYKAIFHEASDRAGFLAKLLGRQPAKVAKTANVDVLLEAVEARPSLDANEQASLHQRLITRIASDYGVALSDQDRQLLKKTHQAFFDDGLQLRFELHEPNGRTYPTLATLLAMRAADGTSRGFLANQASYRFVRGLSEKNRIVPVVGDFAGEHALRAIGNELRKRDLPVSVFYVSNVEQYLMDPAKWNAWVHNVEALPTDSKSLFLRCYLDQGRKHPKQLAGHRTASVLMSFDHFRWRQRTRGYGSFWQLATDGLDASDGG